MTPRSAVIAALTIPAALALAGCSSGTPPTTPSPQAAPTVVATEMNLVNNHDKMFAAMMLVHHEQSVEMSDLILAKEDIDPRVAGLARKIKATQNREIGQLQDWVTQWQVQIPIHDMGAMGPDDGMLSEEEIFDLNLSSGKKASTLFLEQMITHHEGAVSMAQTETRNGHYPQLIELAKKIKATQAVEIQQMRDVLDAL